MTAITGLWRALIGPHEPVSKQFEHMLMREVMRTELIRVRAVIVVSLVIMVNVALVHALFPTVVESVWHVASCSPCRRSRHFFFMASEYLPFFVS